MSSTLSNIGDGREALIEIFQKYEDDYYEPDDFYASELRNEKNIARVLEVLTKFPALARELMCLVGVRFSSRKIDSRMYPVFWLSVMKASVAEINIVYELYPNALDQTVSQDYPQIFQAFNRYARISTLKAMIKKSPQLVRDIGKLHFCSYYKDLGYDLDNCRGDFLEEVIIHHYEGVYPLDRSIEDLEEFIVWMLRHNIETVTCSPLILNFCCMKAPTDVLEVIASKIDSDVHEMILTDYTYDEIYPLSVERIQVISSIFAHLRRLTVRLQHSEGLPSLLFEAIANNANHLHDLTLNIPLEGYSHRILTSFIDISSMSSLAYLRLNFEQHQDDSDDAITAVADGLRRRMVPLKGLCIQHCLLESSHCLHDLLSKSRCKRLHLGFEFNPSVVDFMPQRVPNTSKFYDLKKLILQTKANVAQIIPQLRQIKSLNNLKVISLSPSANSADVTTTELIDLIKQQNLTNLHVLGHQLNLSQIFDSIATNTTLKKIKFENNYGDDKTTFVLDMVKPKILEVLEYSNATLTKVGPLLKDYDDDLYSRINYFLDLNRNGRSKLRQDNTSIQDVVDCIKDVTNEEENHSEEQELKEINRIFGLLKECPNVWSSQRSISNKEAAVVTTPRKKRRKVST